tara:strand:- start:343 stop:576 length:234 start_codon:yes stop_codon:yes gene_type:complete
MPSFILTATDEDGTVTTKEFEGTILQDVVEKTADFLHGVGYVFDDLYVIEESEDNDVLPFSDVMEAVRNSVASETEV